MTLRQVVPALVQSKSARASSTTSVNVTLDKPPRAGNLLVACFVINNGSTVPSHSGTGWAVDQAKAQGSFCRAQLSSKMVRQGDAALISTTWSGNDTAEIHVGEFAGVASKSASGTNGASSVSSLNPLSAGLVPSIRGPWLAVAFWGLELSNGGGIAVDSGHTLMETSTGVGFSSYKVASGVASQNTLGSWTTARTLASIMVIYKAAPRHIELSRRKMRASIR